MTCFLHFLLYTVINGFSMSRGGKGFSTLCNPNMQESHLKEETENSCQQAGKAAACLKNEDTGNGNTI